MLEAWGEGRRRTLEVPAFFREDLVKLGEPELSPACYHYRRAGAVSLFHSLSENSAKADCRRTAFPNGRSMARRASRKTTGSGSPPTHQGAVTIDPVFVAECLSLIEHGMGVDKSVMQVHNGGRRDVSGTCWGHVRLRRVRQSCLGAQHGSPATSGRSKEGGSTSAPTATSLLGSAIAIRRSIRSITPGLKPEA
jgi:hypothetical protein